MRPTSAELEVGTDLSRMRAGARTCAILTTQEPNLDVAVLHRLASRVRSATSSLAWHEAQQRQAVRVARLVRRVPRLVPGLRVTRSRVPAGWIISAEEHGVSIMTFETKTARRTLANLGAPFVVRVHCRDVVNVAVLEQLESQGLIRILVEQTA